MTETVGLVWPDGQLLLVASGRPAPEKKNIDRNLNVLYLFFSGGGHQLAPAHGPESRMDQTGGTPELSIQAREDLSGATIVVTARNKK